MHTVTIKVFLKDETAFLPQCQYPAKQEDPWGLQPLFDDLFRHRLQVPHQSPCNNFSLPMLSSSYQEYHIVRDLGAIDEAFLAVYLIVVSCELKNAPFYIPSTQSLQQG